MEAFSYSKDWNELRNKEQRRFIQNTSETMVSTITDVKLMWSAKQRKHLLSLEARDKTCKALENKQDESFCFLDAISKEKVFLGEIISNGDFEALQEGFLTGFRMKLPYLDRGVLMNLKMQACHPDVNSLIDKQLSMRSRSSKKYSGNK